MSDRPAQRFRAVLDRVAGAAERSGRPASSVAVLAAAKTFPAAVVAEVVREGCRDVGENYVQEARAKRQALEDLLAAAAAPPRWHLIGRLQRNKVRPAIEIFDLLHSVDSLPLAQAIDRTAASLGRTVDCLVEVSLEHETGKAGVPAEELEELLASLGGLSSLRVSGLMTIPPPTDDSRRARRFFRRLRELRDRLADLPLANVRLKELSMGMSADFEIAIEEGATIVRVGTAIFGPRA